MKSGFPRKTRHDRITRINSKVGRDINRSIILNTVRRRQPISRTEISALTELNKGTVSNIVATLIDEELLVESPHPVRGIGRNPVHLSVRQGKHFVGAISLDAPVSSVAVVDIDGSVRTREEFQTESTSPEALVDRCMKRLSALRSTLGPHRFHGVGVSVAGIVDAPQSVVIYAANLGWDHVDLGAIFRDRWRDIESVGIENDAKASALAELLFGKHHLSSADLIFLSLGAGIGAGVAVHGRILSGNGHAAGEIGHMTVVDGGEPCRCGNTGCWEIYASERAPVGWYTAARGGTLPSETTLTDVMAAARAGDEHALTALRQWGQHIGVGIGNMICMLDPTVVIVGGSITQVWDLVQKDIQEEAHGHGVFSRQRTTSILPTSLPSTPALIGAAALCIRRVFADFGISG